MPALFLTTTITCSQAFNLLNRIQSHRNLPNLVKVELIKVIKETIPSCPVKVEKDKK